MTRTELKKIINDAEKYDHEATICQIRHNLYSAVIEFIDEFDVYDLYQALNEALKERDLKIDLYVLRSKKLIEKGKL